jgi:hypothetical protein
VTGFIHAIRVVPPDGIPVRVRYAPAARPMSTLYGAAIYYVPSGAVTVNDEMVSEIPTSALTELRRISPVPTAVVVTVTSAMRVVPPDLNSEACVMVPWALHEESAAMALAVAIPVEVLVAPNAVADILHSARTVFDCAAATLAGLVPP